MTEYSQPRPANIATTQKQERRYSSIRSPKPPQSYRIVRYIPTDSKPDQASRDAHLAKQLGQCCCFSSLRAMAFRPDLLIEVVREVVRVISPTLPPTAHEILLRYALQPMKPFPYPDQLKHQWYVAEVARINKRRVEHHLPCLPAVDFGQFHSIHLSLEWYLVFLARSHRASTTTPEFKTADRRVLLCAKLQRRPFAGMKGIGGCSGRLP